MKIGIVKSDSPNWPKMTWVGEGFESLGHEVRYAHHREEVISLTKGWADLMVLQHKSPGIRWPNLKDIAENRNQPWVQWWFDLVFNEPLVKPEECAYFKTFLPLMRAMDFVFVKEHGLLHVYHEHGVNAQYLDQGCPANMPEVRRSPKEYDAVIWGQAYRNRVKLVQHLIHNRMRVLWVGGVKLENADYLPHTHPLQLPEICSRARYALSVDSTNQISGYRSDRFWLSTGIGMQTITNVNTHGIEAGEYLRYKNHDDVVRILNEGITTDNPRKWVMENHTTAHYCQKLLEKVGL